MNQNKPAVVKKLQERFRNVSVGRGLYIAFVMPTMLSMFSTRAVSYTHLTLPTNSRV